jgi:hypothetical protein
MVNVTNYYILYYPILLCYYILHEPLYISSTLLSQKSSACILQLGREPKFPTYMKEKHTSVITCIRAKEAILIETWSTFARKLFTPSLLSFIHLIPLPQEEMSLNVKKKYITAKYRHIVDNKKRT